MRQSVLREFARLAACDGSIFIDVNHRYNARQYGYARTAARFAHDLIRPSEKNGDVVARWSLGDSHCSTYGHVFTDGEMRKLASAAGLQVKRLYVVDYSSGEVVNSRFRGNLLYHLQASRA